MKLLPVLLLLAAAVGLAAGQDLDPLLLEEVFGKAPGSSTQRPTPVVEEQAGGEVVNESRGGDGDCTCVAYYLCHNNTVITDGSGLIDIRVKDGPCENYLDVCCGAKDIVEQPITPSPPVNKVKGCGVRNEQGIGFRITGDKEGEAEFGEFPWMVAVLREETVEAQSGRLNVYQCGGALIHPKVVLTAAHCVAGVKASRFKIRAGEWDTQTKKELYPHQDRSIETVVIHEQFYAGALFNDIALLFLKTPVDIAENVDVVCLPPKGAKFDRAKCWASGWGKDVFGKEGRYQVILKKIDLPVVPRKECQTSLRETRLGKHFELHQSFICAGGIPGKDTCKGDGGSPLVCPIQGKSGQYVQAGIVAWGIGCGNATPGVYVNVALFRDWIEEQMIYQNLDTDSFKY